MNLRFICVQPRTIQFVWQVEVMLNNFLRLGINPNQIDILCSYSDISHDSTNNPISIEMWNKLKNKFNNVRFFEYFDTRSKRFYIPSIVFNLLKQHYIRFPELEKEALFLYDSDIVFTRTPDFSRFLNDNICYLSDTNSYINYSYVSSKGSHVYEKMCNIVRIDNRIPKIMNSNSGGAQYILKNINANFWSKVEIDSVNMYSYFVEEENKLKIVNPNFHPIQKWTAGMWGLLYNLWYLGLETKVDKYLDFCWATDNIQKWNNNLIYHNSNVISPNSHLFYKGDYINKLPYSLDISKIRTDKCSINYCKEIIDTAKNSCLI